jgi:hypothetical protein
MASNRRHDGKVTVDITTSLDGFLAGPNQSRENPLGEGGGQLHEWVYGLKSFREHHGETGGETNADSEILEEAFSAGGETTLPSTCRYSFSPITLESR